MFARSKGKITKTLECPSCHEVYPNPLVSNDVSEEQITIFFNALATIQKAFPKMNKVDRESLISGLCPQCQKGIFG